MTFTLCSQFYYDCSYIENIFIVQTDKMLSGFRYRAQFEPCVIDSEEEIRLKLCRSIALADPFYLVIPERRSRLRNPVTAAEMAGALQFVSHGYAKPINHKARHCQRQIACDANFARSTLARDWIKVSCTHSLQPGQVWHHNKHQA
jgi:hypothetical protein